MNLQLDGLHAVVTGGSSGIGAAVVAGLAAEGCRVSFCARSQARIDTALSAVAHLRGPVSAKAVDVLDGNLFEAWLSELGPIDIFVANVSALSADWSASLATDIRATVQAVEAVIPLLDHSDHAAITYIGSKAGSLAAPNSAAYGACKAAMAHYMKSLASRLLPRIRVNTVSPGDTLFEGGLWSKVQREQPTAFGQVIQRNPMQRLAAPEEIARVVTFISSPAASFVAGANWYVDGGSTAHVQF
jgi:NAD(P)-dependent dehydrogenase (short-subunit alcohol dehydrogenase family)